MDGSYQVVRLLSEEPQVKMYTDKRRGWADQVQEAVGSVSMAES